MGDLIPTYTLSDFKKLKAAELKQLKCGEITSDGEYLFTFGRAGIGAGEFYIYSRIILPLSGPALATLAIFHFMYNWNDFLWPLLITKSAEMRTLPSGLALFMGQHVVEYVVLMAGATLALAPLFIAFLFAQKYFVQGIALTGLKE